MASKAYYEGVAIAFASFTGNFKDFKLTIKQLNKVSN
jgi:hypothetical protein